MADTPPATSPINPPSPPAPIAMIVAAVLALIAAALAFGGFPVYAGVTAIASFVFDLVAIFSLRSAASKAAQAGAVEQQTRR